MIKLLIAALTLAAVFLYLVIAGSGRHDRKANDETFLEIMREKRERESETAPDNNGKE